MQQGRAGKSVLVVIAALAIFSLFVYLGYSYIISGPRTRDKAARERLQPSKETPSKETPSKEAPPPPSPAAEETASYTNKRFNFSISYPETWKGRESQNGDGITLTVPDEPKVLVRAYGFSSTSFAVSNLASDREEVERANHPDLFTVESRETTIGGRRAIEKVWTYTAQPGDYPRNGLIRLRIVFLLRSDIGYTIEASATEDVFPKFEQNFADIISSFKLR
jgi:hypothetical protein